MKRILKYIKEEVTRLKEAEYDVPEEILSTLTDKLQMSPIERFVEKFKAVNSIPPSYRVFLHNGQHFDVVYESFSLMAKIEGREYYIADMRERAEAVEEINRLLTHNKMVPDKAGENEKDPSAGGGGGIPKTSSPGGGTKPSGGSKPTGRPPAGGGAPKPPTGGSTPGGGTPSPGGGGGTPKPPTGGDDKPDEPDTPEEPMI